MSNYAPNPTWHDDPVHDTLVTAAALNHAEQGIATHTHTESEVTSLTADLAAKAATSHTHAESDVTSLVADLAAKPPTSRAISAGTGLTGGGDLSADRTLTVAYGTTSGTAAQGNDSRLSDTRVASNIPTGDSTQEGRTLAVNGGTYTLTSDQGRVPLKRFRQSLATVDTTPLIWWAIGDSITEGFRASKLDNCYTFRLLRRLQKSSTALGRGGFGYLNTYSNLFAGSGGSDNYWTFSGAGAGGSGTAVFGGRRRVFAVNESATLSFTGTSFQIHYRQGDVTSIPFTITVDGGAPSTVTPGTTGGGNVRGVSTSSTLTHGLHTVVVAPVNPANTMIIYGATIRDGDETSGVRCYNAGLSGATSTSYLNTPGNAWTDQQTVTGDPSLVTIDLATNDYNGGINPSLTQTNLTSLIANVKAACTITPSFLLVIPAQIFVTSPAFAYTGYVAAIRAVAAADPTNVAVLDLTEFFIDVPAVGNAFTRGLINSDQIHPSDAGHTFTAQLILGRLLGIHQPLGVGEAATPDVVTLTAAQTVAGVKAFTSSPTVPTPSGTTDAANKAYVDAVGSVGTPDADATTKGKLQLAGDLGGTAASPTVPTLTGKVNNTGSEVIAGVKTFSSSPIVPTPSGTTDAANKAYVDSVGSVGTPDADATTKGKLQLAGDLSGTATSPTVPGLASKAPKLAATVTKTSAYAALVGDLVIANGTGGGFTVTAPAAVADAVFAVRKTDSSANRIVIAAAGTDVFGIVSTATTVNLDIPGQTHVFVGVSGAWVPASVNLPLPQLDLRYGRITDVQVFTAAGTWTKPAGTLTTTITLIGGGGGGGSGRMGAAGTVRCGGGGGAGAGREYFTVPTSSLGATEAVAVGAGGAGGVAVTTNDTNGNIGAVGGTSTFGVRGSGFVAQTRTSGAGSGGTNASGIAGPVSTAGMAVGAIGGAASASGGVGGAGGDNSAASSGGGAGGGITVADSPSAGGASGRPLVVTTSSGGGGAINTNGTVGISSDANSARPGSGGGGGGGSITTNGGTGGAGGIYGAGGAGGGAALNGNNSGAGGAGGAGIVLVISE